MFFVLCSNNTNKLSPQELPVARIWATVGSNNTNKLSPQELGEGTGDDGTGSNNTNKLSPQELAIVVLSLASVQIIQINLVLKNNVQGIEFIFLFK